jgi:hypothetical protein
MKADEVTPVHVQQDPAIAEQTEEDDEKQTLHAAKY